MDPSNNQLSIRITATSPATTQDGRLRWTVNVHANDEQVVQGAYLDDPFDADQKSLCKWYLEQYVFKSPYSIDVAKEAARSIKDYWTDAIQNLQLKTMVVQHFGLGQGRRHMSIEILDGETDTLPTNTIHQLHWELLEDPRQWDFDNIQILVKRRFSTPKGPFSLNKITSWREQNTGLRSVNLLLVVARDITTDDDEVELTPASSRDITSSDNDEVEPTLASSILIGIRKMLRESNSAVRLNIEIVRPGSFDALRHHLARADSIHGRGYYHAIHLDMHGQVGLRNGHAGKWGFLHFSHPESRELKPCLAPRVAKLLKQHGLHLAILTACKSAQASSGDNANIAKSFVKEGIENILAMSFKVSSTAASIFLGVFYQQLLINGSTFTKSVAAGRAALRNTPNRFARLGLQRELLDWFVPVIYCSGKDLVLLGSDQTSLEPSIMKDYAQSSGNTDYLESGESDAQLTNRDFDLLRMERLLMQRRKVLLHGPQGIGKSLFLRYASTLWTETSLFDCILSIDFEASNISTMEEFLADLWNQIVLSSQSASLEKVSHNHEDLLQSITDFLSASRTMIILDHLHVAYPAWITSEYLPSSLSGSIQREIGEVLETIMGTDDSPRGDTYLICAVRDAKHSAAKMQLGIKMDDCEFELPALSQFDSIALAHSVLKQAGCHIENWQPEDHDNLDLVLSLLVGVPAAIIEILPLADKLQIPWRQFFKRLHAGLFSTCEELASALQKSRVYQELEKLSRTMPPREFRMVMFSSLFWQEGTYPAGISDMEFWLSENSQPTLTSPGEAEQKEISELGEAMAALAADHGLLKLTTEQNRPQSWVHPLLTILGRPFLLRSCQDFGTRTTQDTSSNTPIIEPTLRELAVHTMTENYILSTTLDVVLGVEFEELIQQMRARQANFLFCIEACTRADHPLPLEKWPIYLFLKGLAYLNFVHATIVERRLFYDAWQKLRDAFFTLNGGVKVGPERETFVLLLLQNLATAGSVIHLTPETSESLYQEAISVIQASRKPDSNLEGLSLLRFRTLLATSYTGWLVQQNRQEEAKIMYGMLVDLEEETRTLAISIPEGDFDSAPAPVTKILELLPSDLGINKSDIQNRLAPDRIHQTLKTYYTSCLLSSQLAHKFEIMKPDSLDVETQALLIADKQSEFLRQSQKIVQMMGINGANRASDWWPCDFNMRSYRVFTQDLQRLEAIERSMAAGSWVDVLEHHRRLMWSSFHQFEHEQALEHLQALLDLHGKSTLFPGEVESLLALREDIRRSQELFHTLNLDVDGPQSLENLLQTLASPVFQNMFPKELNTQMEQLTSIMSQRPPENFKIKNGWMRKVMKSITAKKNSQAEALLALQEYNQRFCRLLTLLEGDDLDTIEDALEQVEISCQNEYVQIVFGVVGDDAIGEWRTGLTHRKWLAQKSGLIQKTTAANDFWTAGALVSDVKSYMELHSLPAPEGFDKLRHAVAEAHWEYQMGLLKAAHAPMDFDAVVTACGDLISAWDAGYLPQIEEELIVNIKTTRLRSIASTAIGNRNWKQGIEVADELVKLATTSEAHAEGRDSAIDCREYCEQQLLVEQYAQASNSRSYDNELRQKLLRDLKAIQTTQQRIPVQRNLTVLITDEMIDNLRQMMALEHSMYQTGNGEFGRFLVYGSLAVMRNREMIQE